MFENAPVIFSYSRAEAIADGALFDITAAARKFGFRYPVAITRAAFGEAIAAYCRGNNVSVEGRMDDLLTSLHWACKMGTSDRPDRFTFDYATTDGNGTPGTVSLIVVCGPGDTPEPVLTVMLPEDD